MQPPPPPVAAGDGDVASALRAAARQGSGTPGAPEGPPCALAHPDAPAILSLEQQSMAACAAAALRNLCHQVGGLCAACMSGTYPWSIALGLGGLGLVSWRR